MKATLFTISLVLAWMLSPESLVLFGQNVGRVGWGMPILLILAIMIFLAATSLINGPKVGAKGGGIALLVKEFGGVVSLSLNLASRGSLLLLGATGMLVTAGFAFNEIFVYWFPNFAFATLLLVAIASVNMLAERWVVRVQIVMVAVVVSGLLLLSLLGLLGGGREIGVQVSPQFTILPLFSTLLLFLGIDFASVGRHEDSISSSRVALSVALAVFLAWGVVSYNYVPLERLAESTIPHILTARYAGDTFGRQVMGIVVIAGAFAAVNGLLVVLRWSLEQLAYHGLFPRVVRGSWQGRLVPLVFAVLVCILMFTGLAGEEALEVYLRGALLLWLLHLSILCLAASRHLAKHSGRVVVAGYFVSMVFMGAFLILLLVSENTEVLLRFCLTLLSMTSLFAWLWIVFNKKQ